MSRNSRYSMRSLLHIVIEAGEKEMILILVRRFKTNGYYSSPRLLLNIQAPFPTK